MTTEDALENLIRLLPHEHPTDRVNCANAILEVAKAAMRETVEEAAMSSGMSDSNRHIAGCNTDRRGCVPGCDNYDPKYDYQEGDGKIIADAFAALAKRKAR